jgi:hypothetical protein
MVHLAFIAFVVLGGLLVLWRRWWAALHVPAIAWAVWIEWSGFDLSADPVGTGASASKRARRAMVAALSSII